MGCGVVKALSQQGYSYIKFSNKHLLSSHQIAYFVHNFHIVIQSIKRLLMLLVLPVFNVKVTSVKQLKVSKR